MVNHHHLLERNTKIILDSPEHIVERLTNMEKDNSVAFQAGVIFIILILNLFVEIVDEVHQSLIHVFEAARLGANSSWPLGVKDSSCHPRQDLELFGDSFEDILIFSAVFVILNLLLGFGGLRGFSIDC